MIREDSKKFFKIDRKQNFQFPNLAEYFVYQIRQKRKSNRYVLAGYGKFGKPREGSSSEIITGMISNIDSILI